MSGTRGGGKPEVASMPPLAAEAHSSVLSGKSTVFERGVRKSNMYETLKHVM